MLAKAPTSNRIALRWMGLAVGLLLVWVGRYAINRTGSRRAMVIADPAAHITMEASAGTCADNAKPIGLVVHNHSSRAVKEITFALEVERPDASDNLALDSSNLRWTQLVQAGKQVTICRAWPALTTELSGQFAVNARIKHVAFYEAGEPVPTQ